MSTNTFDIAVGFIRQLSDVRFIADEEIQGKLTLDSESVQTVLALDEAGGVLEVTIQGETFAGNLKHKLSKHLHSDAIVSLQINRLGNIFFSFDDFLNSHDHRFKAPDNFYIIADNISKTDVPETKKIAAYNSILSFIDLLAKLSDIPRRIRSAEEIFFSGAVQIEIPVKFSSNELKILQNVKDLRETLLSTLHYNEKREIFKSIIIDTLSREHDESKFLTILISRFGFIERKFRESYNVYVKKFSIKEISSEIEQNHIDLAGKLHNVMVDLNKSIIVLPIAFIFAATKLQPSHLFSINNTIILICCWVAIGIFFISLAGHKRNLQFIHKEILRQKKKAEEYTDLSAILIPPYEELIKRCRQQIWTRQIAGSCLWIIFITLTLLYIYYFSISS